MIFQKWIFTRVKLPHCKHTNILLYTCHQTIDSRLFWKLGVNLTMEYFKYSNNRQHKVFHWILPSRTQTKINYHVRYLYFLFVCVFFPHFMKVIFPGSDTRPIQVGTWILDLSHDPIWAIWLAEVNKFHQLCDRINHLTLPGSKQTQWWLAQIQLWLIDSN